MKVLKIILLFILFLAALGLRCTKASRCGGFSCCGAWSLDGQASVATARGLSSCGSQALEHRLSNCGYTDLVAPRLVGSSGIRD